MSSRPDSRAAFDRAFVAMSYALGRRGQELLAGLEQPDPAALELVRGLSDPEREQRARCLAGELGRIATALQERELSRC